MARHLFTTVATVPVTPAGLMDEAVRESLIVPVFLAEWVRLRLVRGHLAI